MCTTSSKISLMGVSFLVLICLASPALADPSVVCSVRAQQASKSAAYQPGVDARGNAVAPADVGGASAMAMPQIMRIPLTVDVAERMNRVLPDGVKLEANMGLIEIMPGGKVMINGRDLSASTDAMCASIARDKAAAMKTKDVAAPKKPKVAKPVAPVVDAPVVEAAPAAPVAAPEIIAAPEPEPVVEPVVEPQVLEPVVEEEAEVLPEDVAPATEILSPAEGTLPRPPMDPLSAPEPSSDVLPTPDASSLTAPAPTTPSPDDVLSGGE